MKKIKKDEIKFILIASAIIMALTVGIVKAANTDITSMASKGKNAIGEVYSLGYNNIANKTNTYCIQHHKTLRSALKTFVVDKYVEIDGKTATVYNSAKDSGKEVKSKYNAIVAYIFNQKQGYGVYGNNTQGQKALWYFTNDWVNAIFGKNNDYYYYKNDDGISISNNTVAKNAKEYAANIGSTTSKSSNEKLKIEDEKTPSRKLSKTDVGNGYYRIGQFRYSFEGDIKSITVKADGKKVTDIKFVKVSGSKTETVNAKDIESGDKFYIDVKNAKDIASINVDIKTSKNITVRKVKVWFLKSADIYQNLIHVSPSEKEVPQEGEGDFTYKVKSEPKKGELTIQKVDDRDSTTPLENVGFILSAKVKVYELARNVVAKKSCEHWTSGYYEHSSDTDEEGNSTSCSHWHSPTQIHSYDTWIKNIYEQKERTLYLGSDYKWGTTPHVFYTDEQGIISISNIMLPDPVIGTNVYSDGDSVEFYPDYVDNNVVATEVENNYYGYNYNISSNYTVLRKSSNVQVLKNHQKFVKLSGYVWLEENQGKTSMRNDLYDKGIEEGVNGITVYLKDTAGNTIKTTSTSEMGLYSEINGGEYQFVDIDLDEVQAGKYYVEFEYGGIKYQSVNSKINKTNGSKAVDTNSRNILDSKFTSVEGNGGQSLNINGISVLYNGNSNYESTVNSYVGDNVFAKTDEAGYNLYSDFEPTMEEIRNVNLGLFEKEQTDYAITKDLYNVRVEVNGKSHIYKYGTTRYNSEGEIDLESSWNVGVKFQRNTGTYSRAIYKADSEFTSSNKDRELKVYTTYKIALKNESPYLGKINNIVDYCDSRMRLVHVGTTLNEQDVISNEIHSEQISYDSDKYSKYRIDTNAVISEGEAQFIYVQFEMNREAVLSLVNNGEVLNNIIEVNSYATYKDNNVNTPVAVVDKDSVPGNAKPGQINTYEDDTDSATSLKLEIKNARAITGTVFVDSTGKDSNIVYSNEERLGNGLFDNGETTLKDVQIKLIDVETNQVTKIFDESSNAFIDAVTKTDENGNYEFVGFVPGDYEVVYIWGDKTHKVQYYKGTIYNENRTTIMQGNKFWYRGNTEGYADDIISADTRANDALDNYKIRENIDNEMEKVTKNSLEKEISDAYEEGYNAEGKNITITKMESSTPELTVSVEYPTTITDGTVEQVRFAIRNLDFGIVERPKQQLKLTKRVSAYKLTLSNGQILVDAEISEDGKITGTKANTIYMKPTVNSIGLLKTEMDNELIEGTKLEVTYTIKVKNVSEIDYTSDKYYYYGNSSGAEKVKVSPINILDYVDGRLSVIDDKWKEKDLAGTFAVDYNISEKENAEYLNKIKTYVTEELSKTYLEPDASTTVELKTSKLLTSTDDNEFNNRTEIIETKKNTGFSTGSPVKLTLKNQYFNVADSEKITVIPSTGENKEIVLPIVLGISIISILGLGILCIKKFIINKQ